MTFMSAKRSIQQISRFLDVRVITLKPVTTLYFELSDSKTAVPTPENKSFRLADVVPMGKPDLSNSSNVLMSLK